MDDIGQGPNPGNRDATTHDPTLDEPGMDATTPTNGDSSQDTGDNTNKPMPSADAGDDEEEE